MSDIEFPLVEDDVRAFPIKTDDKFCVICKKEKSSTEYVEIHGGAMLLEKETDNGVQPAILSDALHGFLHIDWESGSNQYAELELASDVLQGQYSLQFCSTDCLRAFFNTCVEKLESKIECVKINT